MTGESVKRTIDDTRELILDHLNKMNAKELKRILDILTGMELSKKAHRSSSKE